MSSPHMQNAVALRSSYDLISGRQHEGGTNIVAGPCKPLSARVLRCAHLAGLLALLTLLLRLRE